ncbi:MAG: SMI1/KNR4 family protein [Clostridiales bacterium]|nr:SMI1/KNR4 family protein [Clostridiales bacterium]
MMEFISGSAVLPLPAEEALHKREQYWKIELPAPYKEFIKKMNGAKPANAAVPYDSRFESIERFLCILDPGAGNAAENEDAAAYDIDVVMAPMIERLGCDEDSTGVYILPIAKMEYGNFLAFEYKDAGADPVVCVWDNEESGDFDPVIYFVAGSFEEFMSRY